MLAFGGTRTWHRLTCAIEDAGFEIRDSMHWIYGSGFPKSLDVSKAIDKGADAIREVVGRRTGRAASPRNDMRGGRFIGGVSGAYDGSAITAPATAEAAQWDGWGTALKPAHEPIVLARKPLAGTVAANVLTHGTGALNIDGCRVAHGSDVDLSATQRQQNRHDGDESWRLRPGHEQPMYAPGGRWPANIVLTHHPDCADQCAPSCPVAEMDQQSGVLKSGLLEPHHDAKPSGNGSMGGGNYAGRIHGTFGGDSGGASRFFPVFRYQAKAASSERPRGEDGSAHPTVKPASLVSWLVRLVTPPGGLVLDPFAGSGTTAEACIVEGFHCVLIEKDPAYAELIRARLRKDIQPVLFGEEIA